VEESREEDGARFAELYPSLRQFAAAIRPPGIDPDDLLQEALARTLATRSLSSVEAPQAYLRTAMIRIASNLARGSRRTDARLQRHGAPDDVVDVYPSDLDDLMRTPPRARAVLFMTIVENYSYREAGEAVGCSEAAARQLASRALRALRAELRAEVQPGGAT
jgi:RNA polymerase sigma factor (sigma-70 family)